MAAKYSEKPVITYTKTHKQKILVDLLLVMFCLLFSDRYNEGKSAQEKNTSWYSKE